MAVSIKRIEKDFLLKVLYDEQLPVIYLRDRKEYTLFLEKPAKGEVVLRPDKPVDKLKPRAKMDLLFNYRGQVMNFAVVVKHYRDGLIFCDEPEAMNKNLDRSYSRVGIPEGFSVEFSFHGDRYKLSFPKVMEYVADSRGELFKNINASNLTGLVKEMEKWIRQYAYGYKMVMFRGTKPKTIEEKIISETGKTLYLPSAPRLLPPADPYPKKRIITEAMFKSYLGSTGTSVAFIEDAYSHFIQRKFEEGVFSEAWIPLLFQEYVIGYIHIWADSHEKHNIDYNVLDTIFEFTKVLAYSLKVNGYFEKGKLPNDPFKGEVIDVSASGMMFSYPISDFTATLLVDSELTVKLSSPNRSIKANAVIVRRYEDKKRGYFGCRFLDMAPEDTRFLFENIYGRKFTDEDSVFLSGQV